MGRRLKNNLLSWATPKIGETSKLGNMDKIVRRYVSKKLNSMYARFNEKRI